MKVLWYVNVIMPDAAAALNLKAINTGGWLTGAARGLRNSDIELTVMTVSKNVSEQKTVMAEGVTYLVLPPENFQALFSHVLCTLQPDIVHVFGTEYVFNTQLIHLCSQRNVRHVVSLQGIMYQCSQHYDDGLPDKFKRVNPLLKWMKRIYYADSIALEKARFAEQGKAEIAALKEADAVIGRTAWDKQCALAVNPNLKYYHVNEILRDAFYTGPRWKYGDCDHRTIFVSQSFYPIKGFHMLLEAMPEILERYPNVQVIVGGQMPYTLNNRVLDVFVDYFFEYQCYVKQLIKRNGLKRHIHYTGPLNAEEMKQRFLKSNVFLSCSTIENSPNSVGEAMLLGVPVVASRVGGTESMLADGKDGILYDFYDKKSMIRAISAIFDHPELAEEMSQNAQMHAKITHDKKTNTEKLISVYRHIQGAKE